MYISDAIMYVSTALLVCLMMYLVNFSIITNNIFTVLLALVLFGLQMIVCSYSFGFIFTDPDSGIVWFGIIS